MLFLVKLTLLGGALGVGWGGVGEGGGRKGYLPVKPGWLSPVAAIILGDCNAAKSHQSPLHSRHVLPCKPTKKSKPSMCQG